MSYQSRDGDYNSPKSELHPKWFGAQEMFGPLNLSTRSHHDSEIRVIGESELEIVIQSRRDYPVKQMTKLLLGKDTKRNLATEYVLTHRNRDTHEITYRLGFPEDGYYRFMIFALDEANKSEDLPNVFNYFIHVDRLHFKAEPFPRQLSDFYDDYNILIEPLRLSRRTLATNYDRVKFCLQVPGAVRVGVHCDEEWTQLEQNSRIAHQWEGYVDLSKHRNKNGKLVSVGANYGDKDDFVVLLDYTI